MKQIRTILLAMLLLAVACPAMAALPVSDNFSGTTLDANWTIQTGTFQVASGVVSSTTSGDSVGVWNADTFPNDQWAQATVESNTTGDQEGVVCRSNTGASRNQYVFRVDHSGGGAVAIVKFVSGAFTSLATGAATVATGSVIKFTCVGTTLTGYVNGVQVIQTSDSSLTSGSAGIYLYGTTSGLGTWSAGAESAGGQKGGMFFADNPRSPVTFTSGVSEKRGLG